MKCEIPTTLFGPHYPHLRRRIRHNRQSLPIHSFGSKWYVLPDRYRDDGASPRNGAGILLSGHSRHGSTPQPPLEGMAPMPRRLALSLLIAWLVWIPTVSAQGPNPQGPPGLGFHGMAPAGPYSHAVCPEYTQPPTLYEQLVPASHDTCYDTDAALGLAETFSRTWFRTEYLWLNYRDPSSQFLGAQPLVVPPLTFDPKAFFPAVDRVGGVRVFQQASLVTLEDANNRDNSGLRFTVGIPTQLFTLEASGFAMGDHESHLFIPTILDVNSPLGNVVIPAIPLTRNGLPSRLDFILFDQGMDLKVQSKLQGIDAKLVFGSFTPNVATEIAPLIGFNYLHYSNRLLITGDDSATATSHRIDSQSNNNVFGPEIGLRMETRSKWITLGVEPKFTFGINRMANRVGTHQIFTSAFTVDPITGLPTATLAEPDQLNKDTLTRFSPVVELSTYARIRLAENLNFSIGYQLMATTNISQSEQNIVFDSSSNLTDPPRIGLDQNRDDFWMQGLNVGLQWQF